jgi:cell division protein ZapA (FtsZ GTPase activity inhibitor)
MPEMSDEPNFLDVKIMGREYRVACSPEERDSARGGGGSGRQ